MARLTPAPPASQHLATRFCRWLMRRMLGTAPRAVPTLTLMNAAFETGSWAIEPALRKLVHLRVARIIGCVF